MITATEPDSYVAELTGITSPATFPRLADALAAPWRALQVLPLGDFQHDCFGYYLTRPDAVDRIARTLERDGDFALSFTLSGSAPPYLLRIRLASTPRTAVG